MIYDLSEAIGFSKKLASKFPEIASDLELTTPGYSNELLFDIKDTLPQLPETYIGVLKKIKLMGVSIGPFNLWPTSYGCKNIKDCLISADSDQGNPLLSCYNENNLIEVGHLEGDSICVGKSATNNVGRIFVVDISFGPKLKIYELASEFEELILIAANMHEISLSFDEGSKNDISEVFKARLIKLDVEKRLFDNWLNILARVV